MERFTKAMCEHKLEQLCKQRGWHTRKAFDDVGGLFIDSYRGLVVMEITNDKGGENGPFGYTRRTARELFAMLDFAFWCGERK